MIRQFFALPFLQVVLFVTLFSPAAAAQTYYVYVAAESEDTVELVRFDGKSAEVAKTIAVGTLPVEIEGPHGITVSPDGNHWYLSLAHGQPYGKVVKYRTGVDTLVGSVELDFFPASLHISPVTGLLYVVNFNLHGDMNASFVSVVDPETMVEVGRTATGIMPHGSRLSPDGRKHYSVAMMSGELFEMDAQSFAVLRRLPTGTRPSWVQPHPTKPFVYVTNNGGDEVVEVDLDQWTVVRRLTVKGGPYNVDVAPDGQILVVSQKKIGSTAIVNLEKGETVTHIANSRKVTHGVVISPDSRYAFVSVEGIGAEPGAVDVIDLDLQRLVAVAETGKQAGGIAFWKMEEDRP